MHRDSSCSRFCPVVAANHGKCPQVFAATATDLAEAIATATLASEDKAGTHVPPPLALLYTVIDPRPYRHPSMQRVTLKMTTTTRRKTHWRRASARSRSAGRPG